MFKSSDRNAWNNVLTVFTINNKDTRKTSIEIVLMPTLLIFDTFKEFLDQIEKQLYEKNPSSQRTFTYFKSTIETPEKSVKYV